VGSGTFSRVMLLENDYGDRVVGKVVLIKGCGPQALAAIENEVKMLTRLKHPNIITYLSSFPVKRHLYLLMEYAPGGDLSRFIKGRQFMLKPEAQLRAHDPRPADLIAPERVRLWLSQLASGLQHIHALGVMHRDLSPNNVLLTSSKLDVVKIADFGLSFQLRSSDDLAKSFVGTPYYMAPEVFMAPEGYGPLADLWSLGVLTFELLTLQRPFPVDEALGCAALSAKISAADFFAAPAALLPTSRHPTALIGLPGALLKQRPEERMPLEVLLTRLADAATPTGVQ